MFANEEGFVVAAKVEDVATRSDFDYDCNGLRLGGGLAS